MPETITKRTGTKVAFGDVVQLSKERSKAPEADGFERYVGLEHLEPGDLKIRSWGDIADGTTFTNIFHPGQVLFGKRRAYQRKVAPAKRPGRRTPHALCPATAPHAILWLFWVTALLQRGRP